MDTRDEIKRHYLRHLGTPSREAEFVAANDGRVIEIWKWDERVSGQGVALYSTIGASVYQSGSTKCEYFIGLLPAEDSVASSLTEVALHGSGRDANPIFGDAVTHAQPLWITTRMHSLLAEKRSSRMLLMANRILRSCNSFPYLKMKFNSKLSEEKSFFGINSGRAMWSTGIPCG